MSQTTLIVMGVSGCGKSTVAEAIADNLNAAFLDADSLHPPENISLMASGVPLSDENRLPWLAIVRDYALRQNDGVLVIACSALKKQYRDILNEAPNVRYVFLSGSRTLIAERMHERSGHFMPESLLNSQFEALESPVNEPFVVTVDIAPAPDRIAQNAIELLNKSDYL